MKRRLTSLKAELLYPPYQPDTFLCRHCERRMPREHFPVKAGGKKISRFCKDCIARALRDNKTKKESHYE